MAVARATFDQEVATGNLHWRMALDGEVDPALLRRAWAAVVHRHEAMRTGFRRQGGSLLQVVHAAAPARLGLVAWNEDDGELCARLGQELQACGFDLGRPPLVRVVLARAGTRHELHVCAHRSVLDDGCRPILLGDLGTAWQALSERRTPVFEAAPVPFRVFAAEQREALESGAWRASVEHWTGQLAGRAPAAIAPSSAGGWRGDFGVAVVRVDLSRDAATAFEALADTCRATPLAVQLAALRAVLARAGAASPVVLGVAGANRRSARDRSIVGPLANLVGVAGAVDPADSLRALVVRAEATVHELHEHGHVPVAAVLPDGPWPSIVVLADDEPAPEPRAAGGPFRPLPGAASGSNAELRLGLRRSSTGWTIEVEHRTALFDRRTIAALVSDLDRALVLGGRDPDVRVGALPARTRAAAPGADAGSPLTPGSAAESGQGRPAAVAAGPPPDSLVALRVAGRPHVHLFHPGGGGTVVYQALAAALPPGWTVTASEDTGRGDTIEELAERYLEDLLARMRPPDVLGGWSMGGLVAYEAIRRLSRAGAARLPALLVLDSPPPIGYGPEPAGSRTVPEFAESMWRSLQLNRFQLVEVDADDDEEAAMCALAASLWRTGEDGRPGWLLTMLEEYRRHQRAVMRYRCSERVAAPAMVVAAQLDERHLAEWRRRLAPDVPVARLPCDHFDVLRGPQVLELAGLLGSLVEGRRKQEELG